MTKLSSYEKQVEQHLQALTTGQDQGTTLDFLSRGDKPIVCTENICRILRTHTHSLAALRYDSFRSIAEISLTDPDIGSPWRPYEDVDMITLQTRISRTFAHFERVGKDMVHDAAMQVAQENVYDSAQTEILATAWDNVPRIDTWLSTAFGAPEDEYHRAVASNVIKGLVKRIFEPGCKFDYVLVLEGEQGIGKSSALAALGGRWYVETTLAADNKDFFLQFQGKAMIEFSEGESLSRTEVKRMKAIISTQVDAYRPPYGRVTKDFPRRCIFVMTTNQDEYLKDETGNRRWLPVRVEVPMANIDWIKENRSQMFAEAYHRLFVKEETIYEFPAEATRQAQSERRLTDPNADKIIDWYQGLTDAQRETGVTTEQVGKEALHQGFDGTLSRVEQMSISTVLKENLKLRKEQKMVRGIRRYRYYPTEIETNETIF